MAYTTLFEYDADNQEKKKSPGQEFTVSEEQLRDKGTDGSGNFAVEEGPYNKINPEPAAVAEPEVKAEPAAVSAEEAAAVQEEQKGKGSNVKPLDVGVITPAISGDPSETEEEKQARLQQRQIQAFAEEHPWVNDKITDVWDKYTDKTPLELKMDIAKYRNMINKPLSDEEMYALMAGRDPNKTKKEVTREKRLAYWADALNQLGNVLAHFYNYGRAKGGSPAAQVPESKSGYTERLRAADMAMRQRGYNDYVNAMVNEQKRKQTREDMEYRLKMQEAQEQRRLRNQQILKEMEWMSPKYKKELERLDIDIADKKVQADLHELQRAFQMMKNEAAKDHAFEMFVKKSSGSGGKGGGGGSKGDKYEYTYEADGKTYTDTDEYRAYERAMKAKGLESQIIKKEKFAGKKKWEELDKAGVKYPGAK